MTRRRILFLLFVVSLGGLIALFIIPNPFLYNRVASWSESGLSYDGQARPPNFRETVRRVRGAIKSLNVSLEFRTSNIGQYENLFQTGPSNSGVRVELSKPSTLAAIIGARNTLGYVVFVITDAVVPNRWHLLDVNIGRDNHVHIGFDGKEMASQTVSSLSYDLSDIALGTAFGHSRTFSGEIKNAAVTYSTYSLNPNAQTMLNGGKLCLFLAGLLLMFLFSAPEETVHQDEDAARSATS